jgi:O-antigen/teichoic acid export membrane protein
VKRDYLHTLAFELTVLVGQVLVYRLAATYWGTLGFGEYALLRRTLSLLQPAVMLGQAVALPRMLAWDAGAPPSRQKGYYVGALLLLACTLPVPIAMLALEPARASRLVFGSAEQAGLVPALTVLLAGVCLHVVGYSYLRGRFRQRAANWLQLLVIGLLPLAIFLARDQTVGGLVTRLGLITLAIAGAVTTALLVAGSHPVDVFACARSLARFGVSRVPADFLHMALLGLPSLLVAHRNGVELGGQVAFAFSLVGMAGSAFWPIGLVLLPQASRLAAQGNSAELHRHVRALVVYGITGAVLVALTAEALASVGVRLFMGTGFGGAVPIVRVCLLAVPPYVMYMMLRSAVDALHDRALNARNLGVAVVASAAGVLVSLGFGGSAVTVSAGVLLGFYALGALTVWDAARLARGGAR